MGAIVSLPFQIVGTWIASCCGSMFFSLISKSFSSIGSSFSTRLSYAFLFLINTILSWVMLTDFAKGKLEKISRFQCIAEDCGLVAVHRINFALGLLHIILATMLVGVNSTANPRSKIQNNFWAPKILLWIIFVIVSFLIPDKFFIGWSTYVSVFCGALFLFVGLILLVDFAHEWAETCIEHVENEDEYSGVWKTILVSGTSIMYLGTLVMIVLMFVFFCNDGCSMNKTSAAINLVLTVLITFLSLNRTIQEYNPNCGLAQAAIVSVYCTYLTLSAFASEPDDKLCNPLIRSKGTRTASVVLGAIFTFVAIAYTTTRAAANSAFNGGNGGGAIAINYDDPVDTEPIVTSQPSARNEMRLQAIREAVAVGTLPESALHDQSWLYDDADEEDEERVTTKYNYALFHVIFFLATQWVAVLLTMNVNQSDFGDFVPVGRTYFYSWVKIVSAWICYMIYGWSLIAPVLMPERFGF
ncbi:Serine incorporator 3 [Wickerhamomyces ciferrii]|uniref:Serine incorporator 3 n=2 Tax=Wickerhamomyces ciferrii TaxID=1041607 RepID=K0K9E7_WICCF|nr:Serine incorporator 3 [Wickerhamomyces ciferrii]AEX09425.1 Tms1 [Wickerhamomyces ciferrii]CCH41535.1 Serine incorporator 3 [Wickerhamomyces ciferrii]